jgi:hypothetical protein
LVSDARIGAKDARFRLKNPSSKSTQGAERRELLA